MKLVVQKQDINKVMQTSQNIVEKKSTMPILQNALLDAKGDTLIVSSSDMEITLISKVKVTIYIKKLSLSLIKISLPKP